METNDSVIILGEDILDPYGGAFKVTKGLSTAFPARVIATPISEAGITGFATGLAIRGFRPVLEIMFGDFITLCADQIINVASKLHCMYGEWLSVPLVIRTPMGGRRGYGATHSQTLEALFLSVPRLTIVAPSHFHDPGELLAHCVLSVDHLTLFIENKLLYPERLRTPNEAGKIDEFFVTHRQATSEKFPTVLLRLANDTKPDVTLIVYGGMAPLGVAAATNLFIREEVFTEVVIPSLVKPFPLEDILPSVVESGRVIIAEEGIKTSGWGAELGSQISKAAFKYLKSPIQRIGAKEYPIPSTKSLENAVLPQIEDIEKSVMKVMAN